jgi:hypothetical protein
MPAVAVGSEQGRLIGYGQRIGLPAGSAWPPGTFATVSDELGLVCIAEVLEDPLGGVQLRPAVGLRG